MLTLESLVLGYDAPLLRAEWTLAPGSRAAVVGPSGAGKSTLFAAIAGFLAPLSGRILWNGQDITDSPPAARPTALIFQDNNLFPHLTAAQNAGLGLRPDLRLGREGWQRVEAVLARVGLEGLGDRKPGALSGGQQSRVALARAALQDKPLILLDEPFAALGPALRREMLDLVREIAEERQASVMMITHDIADARRFADKLIWLAGGVAHPPEETGALLADPPPELAAYLGE